MKFPWVLAALTLVTAPALAQEPNIDALLSKLPKAESFDRPRPDQYVNEMEALGNDPIAKQILAALRRRDAAAALQGTRDLSTKYPANAAAQALRGVLCLVLRQSAEAEAALKRSIAINPKFADAHFWLGALWFSRGRYADALAEARQASQLKPTNSLYLIGMADCAARLGRKDERAQYAKRATEVAPSSLSSWAALARAENARKQPAAALKALGRAAELAPDSASILTAVGLGYINLRQDATAVPYLQRAAALEPRGYIIHAQLGYCYLQQRQFDAAINSLRKAISLNSGYGPAWNHLGQAYHNEGKTADAVKSFQRATELMPGFRPAWEHLAGELRAMGKIDEANRAAARAAYLKPPATTGGGKRS
jgi:protein O-GlcNAc transferase